MDLQIRPSVVFPPLHLHSWNNPPMKVLGLGAFIRKTTPLQLPSPSSLHRLASVSSFPPDAPNSKPPNHFSNDELQSGSAAYRHALKFQKPSVIKWHRHLANSVSLIGTIAFPLKRVDTRGGSFGVYTKLSVQSSRNANRAFW